MKHGEIVKIKSGVWAGVICVISEINKKASFPYQIIQKNGREHNEVASNLELTTE